MYGSHGCWPSRLFLPQPRTIREEALPAVSQNDVFGPGGSQTGLGGQMVQFFVGPRIPLDNGNNAYWGFRAGMTLLLPK